MDRTSRTRRLLTGRVLLLAASLLAMPLGACTNEVGGNSGPGGGGSGGAGGGGASGPQCALPEPITGANYEVNLHGVEPFVCHYSGSTVEANNTVEGAVRTNPDGTIVVDSCHPDADCIPMESTIVLSGFDFSLSIPDGTFVQISVHDRAIGGIWPSCRGRVLVRNLPTWGGTPNPTSDGTFLWLASYWSNNEGTYSMPDDPYLVGMEQDCVIEGNPGLYENGTLFAWRFSFADAPGAEAVAHMGETTPWSIPAGEHAGEYAIFNGASFAACCGHDTFSYLLARR